MYTARSFATVHLHLFSSKAVWLPASLHTGTRMRALHRPGAHCISPFSLAFFFGMASEDHMPWVQIKGRQQKALGSGEDFQHQKLTVPSELLLAEQVQFRH
jgi:hypothetical protein